MAYKRRSKTVNGVKYTTHHNLHTGITTYSQSPKPTGGVRYTTNNFGETYETRTDLLGYVSRRKLTKGVRHTLNKKTYRSRRGSRRCSSSFSLWQTFKAMLIAWAILVLVPLIALVLSAV